MASFAPTTGVSSTTPGTLLGEHAELPDSKAENWFCEGWFPGQKISALRRTINKAGSHQFNMPVTGTHPYVRADLSARLISVARPDGGDLVQLFCRPDTKIAGFRNEGPGRDRRGLSGGSADGRDVEAIRAGFGL